MQHLELLQIEIDKSDCATPARTQMYLQLAIAEQMQAMNKHLDGILKALTPGESSRPMTSDERLEVENEALKSVRLSPPRADVSKSPTD